MKYVILIPIYNDRESLKLLIENINSEIKDLNQDEPITVYDAFTGDAYRNVEIWQIDGQPGASLVINQDTVDSE